MIRSARCPPFSGGIFRGAGAGSRLRRGSRDRRESRGPLDSARGPDPTTCQSRWAGALQNLRQRGVDEILCQWKRLVAADDAVARNQNADGLPGVVQRGGMVGGYASIGSEKRRGLEVVV